MASEGLGGSGHDGGDGFVSALGGPADAAEIADGRRQGGDAAEVVGLFREIHDGGPCEVIVRHWCLHLGVDGSD